MADVENMRYELGKEARAKGEGLHEAASEEFQRGFHRGGFGSNVMPRKFGAGGTERTEWKCGGCGNVNARYLNQCFMCNVDRSYTIGLEDRDGKEEGN